MQVTLNEEEYNELNSKGKGCGKGCLIIIIIGLVFMLFFTLIRFVDKNFKGEQRQTPNKKATITVEAKPKSDAVLKEDIKIKVDDIELHMDDNIELQVIPEEPQQTIATEETYIVEESDIEETIDNSTKKELRNQRKAERKRQKQENKNK